MTVGKLENADLERLVLSVIHPVREDTLSGPGVGLDCGAFRLGGHTVVVSTDPITAAGKNAGTLAVNVSLNDIAASGAVPTGLLLTILLPPSATEEELHTLVKEAQEAASRQNVDILGGHTEVTDSVNRIVLNVAAMGVAREGETVSARCARPGDTVIMTKQAALEGTAILASDREELLAGVLTGEELREARSLISRVSIVPEAVLARKAGASAMHDITEGGVLGAVWEVMDASGCGCVVNEDAIPILEVTRKISSFMDADPLRMISSGSLLITIAEPAPLLEALAKAGIPASVIGKCTENRDLILTGSRGTFTIDPPGSDEIYRAQARERK